MTAYCPRYKKRYSREDLGALCDQRREDGVCTVKYCNFLLNRAGSRYVR